MILKRLRIDRMPGIEDGFEIADLDAGVNVVLGPNASGKSSLCRAVRALLFAKEPDDAVSLEAEFEDERGFLRVRRLGGQVQWERHAQATDRPPLPDERMVSCFTVHLEDLLAEGDTERAIAERIGTILAGGYDLDAVRESDRFRSRRGHGRKESDELRKADAAQEEALRRQQDLRQEERQLDELRTRKNRAAEAASRVETLKFALDLLRRRRELVAAEIALSGFPESMEKLVGDEDDRLRKAGKRLERQKKKLRSLRDEKAEAEQRLEISDLAGDEPTESSVAEYRRSVNELMAIEPRQKNLRDEVTKAERLLADAVRELGGTPPAVKGSIGPDAVRRAEKGLSERRELEAETRAIEAQLALLGPVDSDGSKIETLRRARNALSDWLASPDWTTVRRRLTWPWVILISLIALGAIGIGAWLLHWAVALAALPVLGAAIFLLLPQAQPVDRQESARSSYLETGQVEPGSWTEADVRGRLAELEEEIAAAATAALDADRRIVLERQLKLQRAEAEKVDGDLGALAEEVGFEPAALDGSFVRWLHLVKTYDDARHNKIDLERREADVAERGEKLRSALTAFLERFGEIPDEPDGARLGDRLDRLESRRRQRNDARQTLARTDREIALLQEEIGGIEREIDGVYAGAALPGGDDAELTRRLEQHPAWAAQRERRRDALTLMQEAERRLGDEAELVALVDADDEAGLTRQRLATEELAAEHEPLTRRITTIENAVAGARAGDDLEEARARRDRWERALQAKLEEESLAEVARLLLDGVETEHSDSSRPAVLRDAESWFARFTRNAFELRSSGRRDKTFMVRETATGELRTPAQLSSGTRMQLFLALRLAFALDAERGREPLPIFLDEALTVTDPERFRAVVDCVNAFARERRRQIFYLTAQPHDLIEWEALQDPPKQIRLHRVREISCAMPDLSRLKIPPIEEIPSCEGKTDEEYGALIGVPAVQVWSPADKVHPFHLLRDRLALLEKLLARGIKSVGALRSLLGSDAAELVLTPQEREDLRWRVSLIETFLLACRRGRGRPVDHADLKGANVSEIFLPRLSSLAVELAGDASALLEAIDAKQDERVKAFRAKQREELQAYFEDHGHLDPREPLDPPAIEQRLIAAAAAEIRSGVTTQERVGTLTRSLLATAIPG